MNELHYYFASYECIGDTYIVSSPYPLKVGMYVKCNTVFGTDLCKVTLPYMGDKIVDETVVPASGVSKEEVDRIEINKKKADEFLVTIKECLKEEKLNIKVIDVHITAYADKVVLIYTSDGRIDFRNLVKRLNETLSPYRIQMHQITGREMARCFSGCGICGRKLCCSLKNSSKSFQSVTRKMAKDQNIKQEEFKLLGCCDNLKCCLGYEVDFYRNEMLCYPPLKTAVICTDETEWVKEINVISETITLENKEKGRRVVRANQIRFENLNDGTSGWVFHEDTEDSNEEDF